MLLQLSDRSRKLFLVLLLLLATVAWPGLNLRSPGSQPEDSPATPLSKSWTERIGQIKKQIASESAGLETLYKFLHAHPELSFQEEQTATVMAKELTKLGFDVTRKVGGHGVVAILKNGPGPTILVRTDMDALPVTET